MKNINSQNIHASLWKTINNIYWLVLLQGIYSATYNLILVPAILSNISYYRRFGNLLYNHLIKTVMRRASN